MVQKPATRSNLAAYLAYNKRDIFVLDLKVVTFWCLTP